MPDIKIGASTYEGVEKLKFPLSDGSDYVTFGLGSEEKLLASEYQDYIRDEVLGLVNKVRNVQSEDTITFLATSDPHYPSEQTSTDDYVANKASTMLASKASKALAQMLNLDFTAFMGDACAGAESTTPDMLKKQMEDYLAFFDEANSDVPCFLAIGNHDTGYYYHRKQADGNVHTMTGSYLYNLFTSKSASENTEFGDSTYGGYCYRDFPNKKLRVFLLNTSEKLVSKQTDGATYGAQRLWLANALNDLNSKSDARQWKFLTISHYPADYGNTMPLSELLKAYIEGASINIVDADDGTNVTISFSNNSARFIAHFHGHIHNFLSSRMYVDGSSQSESIQYDGVRVCTPNAQFDRENTYTTVGNRTGISFSQEEPQWKAANTAKGTSFVVNVINPKNEEIHSFCFGAGYDRLISYGLTEYCNVTYKLMGFESSEKATTIIKGDAYNTTLTKLSSEHEFKEVEIIMGKYDVTNRYSPDTGILDIPEVTGDIIIKAWAALPKNFTDVLPTAEELESENPYNGIGYKDTTRIGSSGATDTKAGYYTTGFIHATAKQSVYLDNVGFICGDRNSRICLYDANKEKVGIFGGDNIAGAGGFNAVFNENGYLTELTLDHTYCYIDHDKSKGSAMQYFRICGKYIGEDSAIAIDEEISYGTPVYDVTYRLTNFTSTNSVGNVTKGNSYETFLAKDGDLYDVMALKVTMGGNDVTNQFYSSDTGRLYIPEVTGDVFIIATASDKYNSLFVSEDVNGDIYNGKGYQEDIYLTSGEAKKKTGVTTTGFIPVIHRAVINLENLVLNTKDEYSRIACYTSDKTCFRTLSPSKMTHNGSTVIIDGNGNLLVFNISHEECRWIRICTSDEITNNSEIIVQLPE